MLACVADGIPARCRVGVHKWVRVKQSADHDDDWLTQCRICGKQQSSGVGVAATIFGLFVVASILVWWFQSPLLGGLMMTAAVTGLGWAMGPALAERLATWLSVGWRR